MRLYGALDVDEVALGHIAEHRALERRQSVTVLRHLLDGTESRESVECARNVRVARAYAVDDVDVLVGMLLEVASLATVVYEG